MRYYPIQLDLQGRPVLMVGGGPIAEGKTLQLLDAGARVHIVSPTLTAPLAELVAQGALTWRAAEFNPGDLADIFLVFSATADQAVNEAVACAAAERQLLCNVVDQPALCNFITPALVTRGALQISISTAGGSPSIAQLVKRRIAATIGEEYGALLELTAQLRTELKRRGIGYAERRDLLNEFVESEALACLRDGRAAEAEQLAQRLLARLRTPDG